MLVHIVPSERLLEYLTGGLGAGSSRMKAEITSFAVAEATVAEKAPNPTGW